MEINRFEEVLGGITQADTVEGRFVILVANVHLGTYINLNDDLPGLRVPATAEEAKRAKYVLAWAVDNRQPPIVNYEREFAASLFDERGGWVNAAQGPHDVRMWLTQPGHQEGTTIPSGYKALGYTDGTFTFPSGAYVESDEIKVPGAAIIIADTASDSADDAGKPKYTATAAEGKVGVTETYDSVTGRLTIRVNE
jgi:hypothetical protein